MTHSQSDEDAFEATTADERAEEAPEADVDAAVMEALRSHVPLTLLCDLSDPQGPDSAAIAQTEGGQADWLPGTGRG
jgi:hypothetical protein